MRELTRAISESWQASGIRRNGSARKLPGPVSHPERTKWLDWPLGLTLAAAMGDTVTGHAGPTYRSEKVGPCTHQRADRSALLCPPWRARPRPLPDTTLDRIRCPAFSRVFPKNRCVRAASGISPGTKNFFAKAVPQKGYPPFWARNRFWTGFWGRGHD
jgi:hypothetical protein